MNTDEFSTMFSKMMAQESMRNMNLYCIVNQDSVPLRFYQDHDLAEKYLKEINNAGKVFLVEVWRPVYNDGTIKSKDGRFLFRCNKEIVEEYLAYNAQTMKGLIRTPNYIYFPDDYLIDTRKTNKGFDYFWSKYNGDDVYIGILDVDEDDNYYYRAVHREVNNTDNHADQMLIDFFSGNLDPYC